VIQLIKKNVLGGEGLLIKSGRGWWAALKAFTDRLSAMIFRVMVIEA